jgi:hypothetical protein
MRAALDQDAQRLLGRHCDRVVKQLAEGELVRAMFSCVSGKPGLFAVTDRQLIFVYKPDAMTSARVVSHDFSGLHAVRAVADDEFQTMVNDKWIGYKDLRPPKARALSQMLWDRGVSRPEGQVAPEGPSPLLPSRSADDLLASLREEDRESCAPLIGRICEVLGNGEQVRLVSAAESRLPLLLALTDSRLLWSGREAEGVTVAAVPVRLALMVRSDHGGALVVGLHSSNLPEVAFRGMRPALGESFASMIRELGGADPTVAAQLEAGKVPDQKALSVLPAKTAKLVRGHIAPDETVFLVLVGGFGQALIALSDRMLIAKAGLMSGNTFGGKVTAFPYREVTGLEIHTGFSTGVLVVQTPSFPGTQAGSYWSKGKNQNPAELPNTLPLPSKRVVESWHGHLQTLRAAISGGGLLSNAPEPPAQLGPPVLIQPIAPPIPSSRPVQSQSSSDGLAGQLRELAGLRDSGVLSDAEFAQAKAKLLS